MSKNSIFLSGWEYNRLLADDPCVPRISALPAQMLWNGSAQFFLFEHVYCTQEAFDTEIEAANVLKWSTGTIFQELKTKGFLEPYDWQQIRNDPPHYNRLQEKHQRLKNQYDEQTIHSLIEQGNDSKLDEIKLDLFEPILDRLHCVKNVSPNSINLWFPRQRDTSLGALRVQEALRLLAEPLELGVRLCDPPGTGVDPKARLRQRKVETNVEKPLIPALCMGNLPYADYCESLLPHIEVYKPINDQLLQNWNENKEKLFRLREWAYRHLWPNLHNEWIPRLEEDPRFFNEFRSLVLDAVDRAGGTNLFDRSHRFAMGFLIFVLVHLVQDLIRDIGIPEIANNIILIGAIFSGVANVMGRELENRIKNLEKLTVFYQGALRIVEEESDEQTRVF